MQEIHTKFIPDNKKCANHCTITLRAYGQKQFSILEIFGGTLTFNLRITNAYFLTWVTGS
jgi:hypothetical protein